MVMTCRPVNRDSNGQHASPGGTPDRVSPGSHSLVVVANRPGGERIEPHPSDNGSRNHGTTPIRHLREGR